MTFSTLSVAHKVNKIFFFFFFFVFQSRFWKGFHQHVEKPKAEPKPSQPVDVRFKELNAGKEVYSTSATKIGAPSSSAEPAKKGPAVEVPDKADAVIAVGTACLHNGCKAVFADDKSRSEPCLFHPGGSLFLGYVVVCSERKLRLSSCDFS